MLAACPFPANHGTPGSIREMAEAISTLGHEVHIVTYHFGEDIPVRGPWMHRISAWTNESTVVVGPTSRRPLYDMQMVFKTLEVLRQHRPHVLHAHGYEAALAAWLCRTATGVPMVYSGHNTMADELPTYRVIRPQWLARGLARMLDALVPRLADRCLPHSTNIERFFHGMGLHGRTDPVVNFGIDVENLCDGDGELVRKRYQLGDAPVVLYTGVLDEFQRIDLLLEAIREIACFEPELKLLVVTTIPHHGHQARIRRQAEELGIARQLVLTEPQPLSAIPDFLAAGDVALVPRPDAPGFPIKLLNYMAASRPCALFASSATKGLVHGENVQLVAPDTGAALGGAILELLRDSDLRQRLGEGGHRYICRHHDRLVIAQQICATYVRALQAAGKPVPQVKQPIRKTTAEVRKLREIRQPKPELAPEPDSGRRVSEIGARISQVAAAARDGFGIWTPLEEALCGAHF
jgi:glycosyltransferase involved in cell wall biosynthesis